jgi:hypothetical protein
MSALRHRESPRKRLTDPHRRRNGFGAKCPGMNSIAEMGRWMGKIRGWAARHPRAETTGGPLTELLIAVSRVEKKSLIHVDPADKSDDDRRLGPAASKNGLIQNAEFPSTRSTGMRDHQRIEGQFSQTVTRI